jgi:sugar lactone lactonase YvrE
MVLVAVAGGSVNVLKTGGGVGGNSEPRLSPDGRYIVHPAFRTPGDGKPIPSASGNVSTLHIMPAAGGTETPLVQGEATEADWSPAWTSDGRRVVFFSNRSGEAAVWAVTVVDGKPAGEPERLKLSVGSDAHSLIGFARDGTLYCLRGMSTSDVFLAEIDAESGTLVGEPKRINQTYVGSTGGPLSWSPDGQWLAYRWFLNSQTKGRVVMHHMNTGEDREVPQADPAVAGWFPGGQSLLAGNKRVDVLSGRQGSIPGLEREQPEPGTSMAQAIALSHDGRSVYYAVNDGDAAKHDGRYTVHLVRHDVASGQKREIYHTTSPIPGLYSIAVSPDDRLVAFGELRLLTEGGMSVKVISAEGGEAREVFSKFSWGVAWGGDGRYLLLKGAGVNGKLEFLWVPAAGGPARPSGLRAGDITLNASTDRARAFAVHPDGRHVAFADSGYQQEIVAIKNLLADQKPAR